MLSLDSPTDSYCTSNVPAASKSLATGGANDPKRPVGFSSATTTRTCSISAGTWGRSISIRHARPGSG